MTALFPFCFAVCVPEAKEEKEGDRDQMGGIELDLGLWTLVLSGQTRQNNLGKLGRDLTGELRGGDARRRRNGWDHKFTTSHDKDHHRPADRTCARTSRLPGPGGRTGELFCCWCRKECMKRRSLLGLCLGAETEQNLCNKRG